MKISTETLGELHHILHLTIENEDYKEKFENQIKDLTKKIQLPGFRTGKVPPGLVKQKFGESVLAEELNKIVNDQIGNYLKEQNVQLLGDALPVSDEPLELNYQLLKEYTFSYEVGYQPAFEVSDYLNSENPFVKYKILAKQEEISQEIDRLQKRYGKREDVEAAAEGDVIYVHLQELTEEQIVKENGIQAHSFFNFEMLTEVGQTILNPITNTTQKNIDDIFSVFIGEKEKTVKNILMIDKPSVEMIENIPTAFELKIERISRLIPANVDDHLFNELVKEYGEVNNEAELKEKIKNAIETFNDKSTEVALENSIYKHLNDHATFNLPEEFLRKWYTKTQGVTATGEEFEKQFTEFKTRLRQSILFQKVQKQHDLQVSKEDIIQETYETVSATYGHLGSELIEYVIKNNLENKEFVENMQDRAMQRKFFQSLKSYITTEEKITTLEAFQLINKPDYEE